MLGHRNKMIFIDYQEWENEKVAFEDEELLNVQIAS